MAFRDFDFPGIIQQLDLTLAEADLFSSIPSLAVREEFRAVIQDGTELALSNNTEKARSEFMIAPILFELKRTWKNAFGLFSGIEFNVDPDRGLNGYCDFILTKSPRQMVLHAPLVAIVEAKNDNLRNGLGQCIAAMVAAHEFNQRAKSNLPIIYGVVTTGSTWKFLQLQHPEVTIDVREYYIVDLDHIMGILTHLIQANSSK